MEISLKPVKTNIGSLYFGEDFLTRVQDDVDLQYGRYERDTDRYRNPQAGKLQSLDDYGMDRYMVIDYEELDFRTEEFVPRARILCYIEVQKDYVLEYEITLSFEKYDDAINTLIGELETAYGIRFIGILL